MPSALSRPWKEYRSISRREGSTALGPSVSCQMMSAVSVARASGLVKSLSKRSLLSCMSNRGKFGTSDRSGLDGRGPGTCECGAEQRQIRTD